MQKRYSGILFAITILSFFTMSFAKVGIIVNRDLYPAVQSAIQGYITDLNTIENTSVWLNSTTFNSTSSKEALRDSLRWHYLNDNLEGAIFVGDLPIAEFEIENDYYTYGYARFPTDLYFMDLDGTWQSLANDGDWNGIASSQVFDKHVDGSGTVKAEIWISRIIGSIVPGLGSEATIVNSYFNRMHNRMSGQDPLGTTMLICGDDVNWPESYNWSNPTTLGYASENTTTYLRNNASATQDSRDNWIAGLRAGQEYACIFEHSSSTYHLTAGNLFFSSDYLAMPTTGGQSNTRFYNLFACSNSLYSVQNFLGGLYAWGHNGLISIGSTKTGSMLGYDYFNQPLSSGKSFGAAFKEWLNTYVLISSPVPEGTISWHYGMTLLGAASVRLHSYGNSKQVAFAVNCGGGAYSSSDGISYAADKNFTGGNAATSTAAISGTNDAALYQSERWGTSSYSIPNLANGKYEIKFQFAETYWSSAGARKFDVAVEGQTLISALDVFAAAGGKNKAYDITKSVDLTDGTLNISFSNPSVDQPKICAFVVYKISAENIPPVANAGADQNAYVSSAVTLDGRASTDPDHGPQPLTYAWSQVSGPTATLISPYTSQPTFYPATAGTYTFRLMVSDGRATSSDEVTVTVADNARPVAIAGPAQTVGVNTLVTLDGSASYDPDNGPSALTYSWNCLNTDVKLNGATTAKPTVTLATAGTYAFVLSVSDGILESRDYVTITVTDNGIALPGRIQAEDYATGGEGIGYHDLTTGNTGSQYRTDNVDIEATTDVGGGYNVGWIDANEWLAYNVNVTTAGTYTLTARMASANTGTKTMAILVDGTTVGTFSTNDASGWQSWKDVVISGVSLSAGMHVVKLSMITGGFNLNYVDVATAVSNPGTLQFSAATYTVGENGSTAAITINRVGGSDGTVTVNYATANGTATAGSDYTAANGTLSFAPGVTSQSFTVPILDDQAVEGSETVQLSLSNPTGGATLGSPVNAELTIIDNDQSGITLPGRIEAEDYATGGEGVGYHDLSAGNTGGKYRTDNVDIETTTDAGGGYDVGWIDANEWLSYNVNVTSTGTYTLTARMASGSTGTKSMAVLVDGTSVGTFTFSDASGWQSWKDVVVSNVNLTAGNHVVKLSMTTGGFNLNYIDVATQTETNLLSNGDFAAGLTSWQTSIMNSAASVIGSDAGSAKIGITAAGASAWEIQIFQPVPLSAGKTYTLEFYVKAESVGKNFRLVVEHNGDPWTKYKEQDLQVTQAAGTWQKYTATWMQSANDASVKIGFHFGAAGTDDAWLDNVKLTAN